MAIKPFAAILEDGSLVTWGSAIDGGDSSAVQHELSFVNSSPVGYAEWQGLSCYVGIIGHANSNPQRNVVFLGGSQGEHGANQIII